MLDLKQVEAMKVAWDDIQNISSVSNKGIIKGSTESFRSVSTFHTVGQTKETHIETCMYKGNIVAIEKLQINIDPTQRQILVELKEMQDTSHENINAFI